MPAYHQTRQLNMSQSLVALKRLKTAMVLEVVNNSPLFTPLNPNDFLNHIGPWSFGVGRENVSYHIITDSNEPALAIIVYPLPLEFDADGREVCTIHRISIADPTAQQQIEAILTSEPDSRRHITKS